MKKNIFIIGIGRYGGNLAIDLHKNNNDVTIIDLDPVILENLRNQENFDSALHMDATNINMLKSTSILKADYVVVGTSKIDASIMICVNLKDLGIKQIIAKAENDIHRRILKSLGIKDVVFPESVAALQTSKKILNDIFDIIFQGQNLTILAHRVTSDKQIGLKVSEISDKNFKIFAVKGNLITDKINFDFENIILKKFDILYIVCENDRLEIVYKRIKNSKF